LGYAIWRSAANLHGHVRAGAQMVGGALAGGLREAEAEAASRRWTR